jgi:hypothetical protein
LTEFFYTKKNVFYPVIDITKTGKKINVYGAVIGRYEPGCVKPFIVMDPAALKALEVSLKNQTGNT